MKNKLNALERHKAFNLFAESVVKLNESRETIKDLGKNKVFHV